MTKTVSPHHLPAPSARGAFALRPRTAVIAHRGASATAPENTLAATDLAISHGADLVECDVQRTRDGELVVIHDPTTARTTNAAQTTLSAQTSGRGHRRRAFAVADLTLDQLRRLDAGSWFDIAYADQRIPTLAEWINHIGTRAGMLIEIKHTDPRHPVAHELAAVLRGSQSARRAIHDGRLTVQAFDHQWLRDRYAPLADGVDLGALSSGRITRKQIGELSRWADQINLRVGRVDAAVIDSVHQHGTHVCVWTVDRTADLRRLIDAGADGIITNVPAKLASMLGRRPAHNS